MARCPACTRHYCRECVTEHEHRLLCAACIQQLTAPTPVRRDRRIPFRPLVQLTGAIVVLWATFYVLGQALLLIPSEFHDTYDSTLEDIRALDAETDHASPLGPPSAEMDGKGTS